MRHKIIKGIFLVFLVFLTFMDFVFCICNYADKVKNIESARPFMIKEAGVLTKLDGKDQRVLEAGNGLSDFCSYYLVPLTIKNLGIEDIGYFSFNVMDEEGYYIQNYESSYYDRMTEKLLNVRTVLPAGYEKTVPFIIEVNSEYEKGITRLFIGKDKLDKISSDCQNTVQIDFDSQN